MFWLTTEEIIIKLECKIASLKKELKILWKFEREGRYLMGMRTEIINLVKKIAYNEKKLELMK